MSTPLSYFEDLYAGHEDPYGFASRWYERRKYALTLASLPRERYGRCFEPASSVGVLTGALAQRCDAVLAWEPVAAAAARARERLADVPHVGIEERAVPREWPAGRFDLVVLSELLYFLDAPDRAATIRLAVDSLEPGGSLVVVDWRHPFAEAPCDGDRVHAELAEAAPAWMRPAVRHREDDFLLEVLVRVES